MHNCPLTLFLILLTEPALDCLWRDQLTLGYLIQCMPADLWEVSTIGDKKLIVSIHKFV